MADERREKQPDKHSTLSFKLDNELKAKTLQMLDEYPAPNNQWFAKAVHLMEQQSLKENNADFSIHISELEEHTSRIVELVGNMIKQSTYLRERAISKAEEEMKQQSQIVFNLQAQLREALEAKENALQLVNENTQEHVHLISEKSELQENLETYRLLIAEFKEKNAVLSEKVKQSKEIETKLTQLQETLENERNSYQAQVTDLNHQNNEKSSTIKQLKEHIQSLTDTHKTEIDRITEQKDVEREKALLERATEHQEALTKANNQYTSQISKLFEEREQERQKYQAKIDQLQAIINNNNKKQNGRR